MKVIDDNQYLISWIDDEHDDIIHANYKKGSIITLEAAKFLNNSRLNFQQGRKYKGITYVSHIQVVTPDAKKYFSKEGSRDIEKLAIVATNPFMVALANIFLMIDHKSKVPTKIFSNADKAIQWLNA